MPTQSKKTGRSSPSRELSGIALLVIGIALALAFFWVRGSVSPSLSPTPEGFSAWDGSNYEAVKEIKRSMHDPSSFEHVETWTEAGKIYTTFRGKSAFGATVEFHRQCPRLLIGYEVRFCCCRGREQMRALRLGGACAACPPPIAIRRFPPDRR
jgi:hypothetical protein